MQLPFIRNKYISKVKFDANIKKFNLNVEIPLQKLINTSYNTEIAEFIASSLGGSKACSKN